MKDAIKHLTIKAFYLLNTILLSRAKTGVKNFLIIKF